MTKRKRRSETRSSRSLEGMDSNALILPAKSTNQRKHKNQESEKVKTKGMSKSQERKLKKLEEEKEQASMALKTKENFEKYKILPGAYNILEASKDMGKVQTRREKKRNAIQFSKEGLEDPETDQASKRKREGGDSPGTSSELEEIHPRQLIDDNDFVGPVIVKIEILDNASTSLGTSQEPVCGNEVDSVGQSAAATNMHKRSEEVSGRDTGTNMQQDIIICSPTSSINDDGKTSKSKVRSDESLNIVSSQTSNLPDSLQRPLMVPTVVHVSRPVEVEKNRRDLPIVMMEQEIMEAVNYNHAIIICGETGCGKTTQVPQFLYEAGFGSYQCGIRSGIIGVTQPRRVAVLATAKRVAFELGLHLGKEVGFQVRHDKKIGDNCSIKFMTDGILLRELKYDILLRRYSVIILDEAHERSLNTDILIGMLSRIVQPRQDLYEKQQQLLLSGQYIEPKDRIFPLKLILMSATMRVEDFMSGGRLFRDPPLIEIPTRQFPVTLHFSKRTEIVDYIGQAYKKVMSIHKSLPQGGILVFVTGQREVEYLCRKLRIASKERRANTSRGNIGNEVAEVHEMSSVEGINMKEINEAFEIRGNSTDQQTDRFSSYEEDQFEFDENESDASYDSETESEIEIVGEDENSLGQKSPKDGDGVLEENWSLTSLKVAFEALAGKNSLASNSEAKQTQLTTPEGYSEKSSPSMEKVRGDTGPCAGALCVLPLYAMLPAAEQLRVFEKVKEGERLVVVATNVAETSLTIPDIKYVVDTGREKVKKYNYATGMESYEVQWISKASAAQRAGRAGRTGPGHCYRLYSSAVFSNIFPDFSCAEISKVPVEGVVLLMKSMNIDKVANFPFPTPPEATALVEAECCLKALEALDGNGRLTTLGKAMAHYPMSPRHSRMLLMLILIMKMKSYTRANLVLGYAVAAAAALSLSNPFVMQLEGSHTDRHDLEHAEGSKTLDGENIMKKKEKLRKKKLKELATLSHAQFSNPSSDALTVAYVLQCFELSESPVVFCNENKLHLKTMEEMSKLRKQLLQLVFSQNINGGLDQDFLWTDGTLEDVESSWRISSSKNILLQNEEELLCQAICAGWVDRVAKRVRPKPGSGDRKVNAVRYQACMVKEDVFLHRRSLVANSAPEFLVYGELLHTKRPYMHGATRVKSDWLIKYGQSLCSFSKSLEGSEYYYDCQTDQISRLANPIFGPHRWELPLHSVPVISGDQNYVAVFACALLEGRVLPCLKYVQKFMAAPPSSILRPEESSQRRVGKLLNKLKTRSIDSWATLKKAWEENPKILHTEILDWFQKGFHIKFEELWSQMLAEIHLDPQERFPKRVENDKGKK
ncbi:hypothetical protein Ddye_017042 [Dipteronia dyeriana]|uniref:RNA helicase n=1 Tax=Dipteronia dyeriana TaxID=168575 RepID=A0AAD9U8K7_9ROSI|nr:hypothetical protein Ddye_017042 [Dipteronia dyeriana]